MEKPALAYHEYLGPAMFVPSAELTLAAARIQPHERVLDVACGTGILTTRVRAARVVGLDANPRMLEVARTTPGIDWIEGNALALPFADGTFDVVLCQQGLQFFPDRVASVREIRRVGGRAVVACWQTVEYQALFATVVHAQAKRLGVTVEQAGMPFMFGDADALRGLLHEAGFANVEVATHVIDARFPEPERFLTMCTSAALATMPERFGHIDPAQLAADVRRDCADDLARYSDGDTLRFPMPTNVACAW